MLLPLFGAPATWRDLPSVSSRSKMTHSGLPAILKPDNYDPGLGVESDVGEARSHFVAVALRRQPASSA